MPEYPCSTLVSPLSDDPTGASGAPQKLLLCGGGESNHEAEVVGFFLNAADFVLSIFFLVVLHPLVDVLFSVTQLVPQEPTAGPEYFSRVGQRRRTPSPRAKGLGDRHGIL